MNPAGGWYDRISEAVDRLTDTESDWTDELEQIELQRLENEVQLRDQIQTIDHLIEVLQAERRKADSKLARLKRSERLIGMSVTAGQSLTA